MLWETPPLKSSPMWGRGTFSEAESTLTLSPVPQESLPLSLRKEGHPQKKSSKLQDRWADEAVSRRHFQKVLLPAASLHGGSSPPQARAEVDWCEGTACTYLYLVSWGQLRRMRTLEERITLTPRSSLTAQRQPRTDLSSQGPRAGPLPWKAARLKGMTIAQNSNVVTVGKLKTLNKSAFRCLVELRSHKHWVIGNKVANTLIILKGFWWRIIQPVPPLLYKNSTDVSIHSCANGVSWFHVSRKRICCRRTCYSKQESPWTSKFKADTGPE